MLCEFTTMQSDLASKRASIIHAKVPSALVREKQPAQAEKDDQELPPLKLLKGNLKPGNPNRWHPRLKEALTTPLAKADQPTFTAIMRYCNVDTKNLFQQNRKMCAPNVFFGKCNYEEKCMRDHSFANDNKITDMLSAVNKFIRDPTKIKPG